MIRNIKAIESDNSTVDRRQYLRLAGATAATVGGVGTLLSGSDHGSARAAVAGAPLDAQNWSVVFEDTFDGGSLDTDRWSIGFGWGREHGSAEELIVDANVVIENGLLRLGLTDGGDRPHAGAVNTKNKATFGPGSYAEAEIRAPGADGTVTAFWSKPNSEAWPPELDCTEIPDFDGSPAESHHTAHWSDETGSTAGKDKAGQATDALGGGDLSEQFVTYGCEWRTDRVTWYVEGEEVWTLSDGDAMERLNAGAPYYMMLNPHSGLADWVPSPSMDGWPKSMDVRRVGLYEYTSESSASKRYLWVRSMNGPSRYRFEVSGSIEYVEGDGNDDGEDYVSDDGLQATGTVDSAGDYAAGDGFWIIGELTGFDAEEGIELFVDDERADPSAYGPVRDYDVLVIERHPDSSGRVEYILETDGRLEKTTEGNASVNAGDDVNGRKASGAVFGGRDAYRVFDGSVLDISTFGGEVVSSLNGERREFTDS